MKKIIVSVFVFSVLLPTFVFASFDTSLKYGSKGNAVVELQDFLVDQGFYSSKVDGKFGLMVRKAVVAFQTANGLSGDGYFGFGSRKKANNILASELQSSNIAEQAETETISTISNVKGCTTTSAFSVLTGQPCNPATQPISQNLPVGCISSSGFSVTTGQACNGVSANVVQLQQTVQQQTQVIQQIAQNTAQIAQNTAPVAVPVPVLPITPTYTITKNRETILSNVSLAEVRTFTGNLNNYVSWKTKAKTATIKEMQDSMLSPNGYTLTENN